MYGGYFLASGTTSQENYSRLTHCEAPIPEGSKPYLPCLLITCGSGNIITKVHPFVAVIRITRQVVRSKYTTLLLEIVRYFRVADPGFRGGRRPTIGQIHFQNLHENKDNWTEGACIFSTPIPARL